MAHIWQGTRSASMPGASLGMIEVAKTKQSGLLQDSPRDNGVPPVDHNGGLVQIGGRHQSTTATGTRTSAMPVGVLDPLVS